MVDPRGREDCVSTSCGSRTLDPIAVHDLSSIFVPPSEHALIVVDSCSTRVVDRMLQPRLLHTSVSPRFYRILRQAVEDLPPLVVERDQILVQPYLDPHQQGTHRILQRPKQSATSHDILKLVGRWEYNSFEFEEWVRAMGLGDEDASDQDNIVEHTLWMERSTLKETLRQCFAHPTTLDAHLHQTWAIRAYQMLREQHNLLSSSSYSLDRGVAIVATSQSIGQSADQRTRMAYRIRIENVGSDVLQLLGRTWLIQEYHADGSKAGDEMQVHAPQTGAVGQLPVLQPGQVFEYMSGCELATQVGEMKGCFHLAKVQSTTKSAVVGQFVDAFHSPDRFEVAVTPFPLRAN